MVLGVCDSFTHRPLTSGEYQPLEGYEIGSVRSDQIGVEGRVKNAVNFTGHNEANVECIEPPCGLVLLAKKIEPHVRLQFRACVGDNHGVVVSLPYRGRGKLVRVVNLYGTQANSQARGAL